MTHWVITFLQMFGNCLVMLLSFLSTIFFVWKVLSWLLFYMGPNKPIIELGGIFYILSKGTELNE